MKVVCLFVLLIFLFSLNLQANSDEVSQKILDAGEEIFFYLEPYNYDVDNRRDPFEKFIFKEATTEGQDEEEEINEETLLPLQRYQLSDLKLLGIMWNIETPRALILDPSGNNHVLVRNDRLGEKNGYIAAIRESEIVVVQSTKKKKGPIKYEAKVINLK